MVFPSSRRASDKPRSAKAPKLILTTPEDLQARSAREVEQALGLEPDIANGLEIYRTCALCHEPEGWGLPAGTTPQIAGQHRTVLIKQLADIRSGNRDGVLMAPYSAVEVIGGPQAVSDVAAYIDTLAEVHFHLGNRAEAIRYSERAVALQHDDSTLKQQLLRFRNAPLP